MATDRTGSGYRVQFYSEQVKQQADAYTRRLLTLAATEYRNTILRMMRSSPRSGRIYRRGRVTHKASAPGEAPAPDTGKLMQSVTFGPAGSPAPVVTKGSRGWKVTVGSVLRYALYLEFGAAGGSKGSSGKLQSVSWILFPRPVWGPAMQTLRQAMPNLVRRASGKR